MPPPGPHHGGPMSGMHGGMPPPQYDPHAHGMGGHVQSMGGPHGGMPGSVLEA